MLVVASKVIGSAKTKGEDSANTERRIQHGERGNRDDKGGAKQPTEEHLIFYYTWEGDGI